METKNINYNSTIEDIQNDYENRTLVQNKISNNKNKINKTIQNKKIIINLLIIIIIFSIILLLYIFNKNNITLTENIIKEKKIENKNITKIDEHFYSNKWVVITTIRPPNRYINIFLIKIPEPWKFVVIGNIKTNNKSWDIYKNSTRLKYLSMEEQIN